MDERNGLREKAKINRTEKIYGGKYFSFVIEDIILPSGRRTEMAIVRHPGSTAVVPLLDDGEIVMISQYRHAVGDYLLEIPAGTIEPGESPNDCATRELEEETGFVARELIELAQVHIIPAYSDEKICIYLARGHLESKQNLDQDEIIHVVKSPLEEVVRMIEQGRITDALTILSIKYATKYIFGTHSPG
jgi:ADP-ribose diphosphatase